MEGIEVYSKRNFSSIKKEAEERFSSKELVFHSTKKDHLLHISVYKHAMAKFWYFLSEELYELLIYEKLQNKLNAYTDEFTPEEKAQIYQLCLYKAEEAKTDFIHQLFISLRKMEYITNKLNLDGFMVFGLTEFDKSIEILAEDAVDEYLAMEEYRDFLSLLKDFLHVQTSQIEKIIVVVKPDGSYLFLDEHYTDITEDCKHLVKYSFLHTETKEEEQQNDLLMSVLVLLVPERIYLVQSQYVKNKNFIITLKAIFAERLEFSHALP